MPQIYISPHNKICYLFLSLTILFFVSLSFGIFGSSYGAQIIITPKMEEVDVDSLVQIREKNEDSVDNALVLIGQIFETIQEGQEKTYPQSTVSVQDYSEGEIIVKNNNQSALNFISSTRFSSPEGLIFRAINRINVPPKGEASVLVRAEKMGPEYDIGPTQFTIPNLKDSELKNNIIAESKKPMSGGLKKTGIIMQSDIDKAKKELGEKLYQKGIAEVEKKLTESNLKIVVRSETLKEDVDAKASEEKTEFTVSEKLKIGAAAFKEKDLLEIAIKSLKSKIPQGKELSAYEPNGLTYRLTEYDLKNKQATLELRFRGYMVINDQCDSLEKTRFRGLTREEVENYLKDIEEVKGVEIKFWPPLILKTMPQSTDKIKIKIVRE